jgi:hypothetical protein
VDLFARIAREAQQAMQIEQVTFTGGEPTLHRDFAGILATVADLSLACSFVTNGWHFERVWPLLVEHRHAITHVSFSLDGATREAHDGWRGRGSFDRVVQAFTRCWAAGFPFKVKVTLRRDTAAELERIAIFAARMGAAGLSFAHVMPTSAAVDDASALTDTERAAAEREIALLARLLKMPITLDVGYYNTAPEAPARRWRAPAPTSTVAASSAVLQSVWIPRRPGAADVAGDLAASRSPTRTSGCTVWRSISGRRLVLASLERAGRQAGLGRGSPCLFCLGTLGKTPWTTAATKEFVMSATDRTRRAGAARSRRLHRPGRRGRRAGRPEHEAYFQLNATAS